MSNVVVYIKEGLDLFALVAVFFLDDFQGVEIVSGFVAGEEDFAELAASD